MSQCEWFARCDNDANGGVVSHPILGYVPTCERCADKLDLERLCGVRYDDGEVAFTCLRPMPCDVHVPGSGTYNEDDMSDSGWRP